MTEKEYLSKMEYLFKAVGVLLILSGSMGTGLLYCRQQREKEKLLREGMHVLDAMVNQIRYETNTLSDVCRKAAGYVANPYSDALQTIGVETEQREGNAFGEIFQRNMMKILSDLPLSAGEKYQICGLFKGPGYESKEAQIRKLLQAREQLDDSYVRVKTEMKNRCLVARWLSILLGCMVVVLLL